MAARNGSSYARSAPFSGEMPRPFHYDDPVRKRRPARNRNCDRNGYTLWHDRETRTPHLSTAAQPFLIGTTANHVEASEATEREIDIEVRDIVARSFERASEVLRAHRADLDEGARLLLAQETVTADQFPAIRSGPQTKSTVFDHRL